MDYRQFLERKTQLGGEHGFEPTWLPDWLFPFQRRAVAWAVRKGRAAILADTGLGKTAMQLAWAENVVRRTNRPVLVLAPLAVGWQTVREAGKFGVAAVQSRDGKCPAGAKAVVTNYERLHLFEPDDFAGCVCDESGILKSFSGVTRKRVTRFVAKLPFRLLCTATAAPNDYVELGTSSEALGELSHTEMLRRFFRQLDDKGQKREAGLQESAERLIESDPSYYRKLAYRVAQTIGQWRLKHHAVRDFWRWVASWAMAFRRPSDLGFPDGDFALPPLTENVHIVEASPPPGRLFNVPAFGMAEERAERRRTLRERCECAARLVLHSRPAVVWCQMNDEADLLVKLIPGAEQVAGRTPDDEKERLYEAFAGGSLRVMVIKPKIGAWGLNWQHCDHVVAFPTHSYEQQYQLKRRCWRFGQKNRVTVDVVATEGEVRVLGNLGKKAERADRMFAALVAEMNDAAGARRDDPYVVEAEVPSWLSPTN